MYRRLSTLFPFEDLQNRPCIMINTTSQNISNNFKDCVDISHPIFGFDCLYLSTYIYFSYRALFSLFLFQGLWDETFLSIDCHVSYWSRNCQESCKSTSPHFSYDLFCSPTWHMSTMDDDGIFICWKSKNIKINVLISMRYYGKL